MEEIFKDIPNYEGMYQVSDMGRVKSLARKGCLKDRILKPYLEIGGYFKVVLRKDNKTKTRRVHQLVAEAFLSHVPCGYKLIVNHEDHDRLNNKLDNLEITTNRNNTNQKHLNSSSEYTGVSWAKHVSKWKAQIRINGKSKHLGYFTDDLEASNAYEKALSEII